MGDIDQRDCKGNDIAIPLIENINFLDKSKIIHGEYTAKVVAYAKNTWDPTEWTLEIAIDGHKPFYTHTGKFDRAQTSMSFTFEYPYVKEPVASDIGRYVPRHMPGYNPSLLEEKPKIEPPVVFSSMVRTETVQLQTDQSHYEAASSIRELPPPTVLAEKGWNHSACEAAFNNKCWSK